MTIQAPQVISNEERMAMLQALYAQTQQRNQRLDQCAKKLRSILTQHSNSALAPTSTSVTAAVAVADGAGNDSSRERSMSFESVESLLEEASDTTSRSSSPLTCCILPNAQNGRTQPSPEVECVSMFTPLTISRDNDNDVEDESTRKNKSRTNSSAAESSDSDMSKASKNLDSVSAIQQPQQTHIQDVAIAPIPVVNPLKKQRANFALTTLAVSAIAIALLVGVTTLFDNNTQNRALMSAPTLPTESTVIPATPYSPLALEQEVVTDVVKEVVTDVVEELPETKTAKPAEDKKSKWKPHPDYFVDAFGFKRPKFPVTKKASSI